MLDFELTLLEEDQVKEPHILSVLNTYGLKAPITDLAILTDIPDIHESAQSFYAKDDKTLFGRCGSYFLKTFSNEGTDNRNKNIYYINASGARSFIRFISFSGTIRNHGIRPVLVASKSFVSVLEKKNGYKDLLEVSFGEYPQYVEQDREKVQRLNNLFQEHKLKQTGKTYTFDATPYYRFCYDFFTRTILEYELDRKKYIPYIRTRNASYPYASLTNKEEIKLDKTYWIKVEPITWLYDIETNLLLSKRILLSGVPFSVEGKGYEHSDIKKYIDTYMVKEIIPYNQRSIMDENPSLQNFVYWKKPKGRR